MTFTCKCQIQSGGFFLSKILVFLENLNFTGIDLALLTFNLIIIIDNLLMYTKRPTNSPGHFANGNNNNICIIVMIIHSFTWNALQVQRNSILSPKLFKTTVEKNVLKSIHFLKQCFSFYENKFLQLMLDGASFERFSDKTLFS